MEQLMFTPASLLSILLNIEELSEYDIGLSEDIDGSLQLQIGNSIYEISPESIEDVETSPIVVDELLELNESTYDDLVESESISLTADNQPIESGLIKELVKTLFIGGVARMAANTLKN